MNYAKIGSISTGTLLPTDLAQTFVIEFGLLAARDTDAERKSRTLAAIAGIQPALDNDDEEALVEFVAEDAPDLFAAYCAPFTHFGSHPGDGADIGIWPDIDSVQEAARFKDGVISVPAGDPWPPLADGIDYVVEVNDHGNVSLYDARTHKELWSCV